MGVLTTALRKIPRADPVENPNQDFSTDNFDCWEDIDLIVPSSANFLIVSGCSLVASIALLVLLS